MEKVAPILLIFEALPLTSLTEWLAWKTRAKDIMGRYLLRFYLRYISLYISAWEIYGILIPQIFQQLRRKDTLTPHLAQCKMEASQTGKEVNKPKLPLMIYALLYVHSLLSAQ